MDAIIVIAIIWFVVNLLVKGAKSASQSGQRNRPGQAPPGGAQPRPPYRPPLTPTARPFGTGAPDWGDIMTMLGGGTETQAPPAGEGMSTEAAGPSGSLTGPDMMEGSPSMLEGPDMMEGSVPMMDANQPYYEGTPPGKAAAEEARPEMPEAPLRRHDPAAMRNAVVWAEILAKPKALRRVAR